MHPAPVRSVVVPREAPYAPPPPAPPPPVMEAPAHPRARAAAPPAAPTRAKRVQPRRERVTPKWLPAVIALVVLVAAAGGTYWWLLKHPRVEIVNNLTAPIAVTRDGAVTLDTVAAGQSATQRVARSDSLHLSWVTVATGADGAPLTNTFASGQTVPFNSSVFSPTVVVASANDANQLYFSPAITNDTGEPLAITVNETVACECEVPSGAKRMPVGYYKLYRHSSVRATTRDGRTAMFNDVDQSVNRNSGRVALRFRAADMRPRQ